MRVNAQVYILNGPNGNVKVGHSKNPTKRAAQIGKDVSVRYVTGLIKEAERVEKLAHRMLEKSGSRIERSEWFIASVDEAITAIKKAMLIVDGVLPDPSPLTDIIQRCGGAKAVSDASRKTKTPVKLHAVYKWIERGSVPPEYWMLLVELGGVTLDDVFRANASTVAA